MLTLAFDFSIADMAGNSEIERGHHVIKLDGTSNFNSWKYGVWMLLEKAKLTGLADGTETIPERVIM